jgi:hypothetical protein
VQGYNTHDQGAIPLRYASRVRIMIGLGPGEERGALLAYFVNVRRFAGLGCIESRPAFSSTADCLFRRQRRAHTPWMSDHPGVEEYNSSDAGRSVKRLMVIKLLKLDSL